MSKKHVSRKLKSSWRKHIDISDVEQFLEDQRQDERAGDRSIPTKADVELYRVEKQPTKPKATMREIRRQKFEALPRSLLPLVNTSNVSDPIVQRNVKKNRNTLPPVAQPLVRVHKKAPRSNISKPTAEDIWARDPVPETLSSEWIGKDLVHHTLRNTGKPLVINLPERMDSRERYVPLQRKLPHSGSSYNPAIDDYLNLKAKVVKQEMVVIKKEDFLERNVTQKFVKMTPDEKNRTTLHEMSEGLIKAKQNESESEKEDEDDHDHTTEVSVEHDSSKGQVASKTQVTQKSKVVPNSKVAPKAKEAPKAKIAPKPKASPKTKVAPKAKAARKIQVASEAPKATETRKVPETQDTSVVKVQKRKKPVSKTKLRQRVQKYVEEKQIQQELNKLLEIENVDEINKELEKQEKILDRVKRARIRRKKALRNKIDLPYDFVEPTQLSGSLRTLQPLNNLVATGVVKARKISIIKKTRTKAMRKERPIQKTRYTRKSHKVPLSEHVI